MQLSNNQTYTLSPSLVEIYRKMAKLCCFNQDNRLSQCASVMQNWLNANGFTEKSGPQALQIWTHWTVTSGTPCWKSIINSSSSRSIRQLMSWKSLCRPFGKRCHENTWTRRWRSSPSAWLPTWLWLPMVVTPSICSNSAHPQVCILISSPTNWLFSETPTDYPCNNARIMLGMLRNGGLYWLK